MMELVSILRANSKDSSNVGSLICRSNPTLTAKKRANCRVIAANFALVKWSGGGRMGGKLRNGLFMRRESDSSHIDILIGFADRVHLDRHIFSASNVITVENVK